MTIKTIFLVKEEHYQVNGTGQDACNIIRKQFPKGTKIVLVSFVTDEGKLIPTSF